MTRYLLLILGLILLFLEFYLPGAILGTIGAILILFSLILAISESQSGVETALFFVIALIAVIGVIKLALYRIPRGKKGFNIYLNTDQEGYQASTYDKAMIGKKGIVDSDLKPGGYIRIEGKQYQAISVSGYITKGQEVIVIGGEAESLLVKQVK
jgi:membrane-bound serine protease (ClpP class)